MNFRKKWLFGCAILAASATGCGRGSRNNNPGKDPSWVPVVLKVENIGSGSQLNLAAADSYTGSITGCVSGYSKSLTKADLNVNVQDGDFDCVFKLTTLAYGGQTYNFVGDENWATGGSFSKTGSGGTEMNFSIVSQLASPVSGTQSITIVFGASDEGTDQTVAADVSTAVSITGVDPLGLTLAITDVKVQNPSGAGLFNFDFVCSTPVVGTGDAATCNGQVLKNLDVRLAVDSSFPNDLSLAECRAAATGAGSLHGAFSGAIGGNGGMSANLVPGPVRLFSPANAHLMLAVSGVGASGGCSYWRIAISAP